jgi:peptide/nickel transport system permease protein
MRYWINRVISSIFVLFIVTILLFAILRTLGNPVLLILGQEATQQLVAGLTRHLGLQQTWYVQYGEWVWELLHGNLGNSFGSGIPVTTLILQALPVTLELTFLAMLVSVVVGVSLGIIASLKRDSWFDALINVIAAVGSAVPNFFIGILLILLFALILRALPATGFVYFTQDPLQNLQDLILPTITLSLAYVAGMVRMARASMLDMLQQQYIVTARAKGARRSRVIVVHALRNALIPIVTFLGLNIGSLLGGAVVTESLFRLPGMGRLLVDGISRLDIPVVQGAVLVAVLGVLVTNILVDISYTLLDPRIRNA